MKRLMCIPWKLASVLLLVLFTTSNAQRPKYYQQWFFGDSVGLDFRQDPVQKIYGSSSSIEGSASICDPVTGDLLFYTNGESVWNRNHEVMPNGQGLFGHTSSTQSALIVPLPGSDHIYYVFTADAGPYIRTLRGVNYSIVNMDLDFGFGNVTAKNQPLLKPATEKLVGVRHCNGEDFWIVAHELYTNRFVSWKLTANGITDTVYSAVGRSHDYNVSDAPSIGYLKASPNGRYLFSVLYTSNTGDLLEFDNETGQVLAYLATLPATYGASFSPNNKYLYTADSAKVLLQYVIEPDSGTSVVFTRRVVAQIDGLHPENAGLAGMQIGPDRKIYVAVNLRSTLSVRNCSVGVIDNPDLPSASFNSTAIVYGTQHRPNVASGLPNCIDGYVGDFSHVSTADKARIVGDTIICFGGSTQLQVAGGVSYRWTPSVGLSCDDCPDPIATPDTTTTYSLEYAYSLCRPQALDTVSITITVKNPLKVDAGEDTVLCFGASLQLSAVSGDGVRFQWQPSTSLSCDDCPNPVATPSEPITYYLTATDSLGCIGTDSIRVDIAEEEFFVSADTAVCAGKEVALKATGRTDYRWRPSEGLSCDDCPNPVATPQQTTTYIVEGSTNGLCVAVDTVTVTVHELPIADAGADTKICLGDSVQLQASGGVDYFWTSSTLSGVHRPDPIAFPITTTTYHVRVTNEYGCIAWDSVTVTVENNGSVLAAGDTAFCAGGTAQLFAVGAASYRWTPTIGLSCEDCPDPQATPTETTTYYVLGSNTNGGCPAVDSVTVVVHDFPIAEAGEGGAVCSGESIELNASGGARYRWDASVELSCEDCPDPQATPTETRTYYVTVWNAEGCSSRDSVEVVVHPDLVVVAGEVKSICFGKGVELQAEGGVRWEWSPAEGLNCTDCPNPEAMPSTTTMYRVRAWNAEGCEAEDSVEVQVREEVEVIRMRISRDHHGGTGEEVVIPIEVVEGFGETDISELELRLTYDPAIMRLDKESFARLLVGTALEGWSVEIVAFTRGEASVRLVAPEGEVLTASSPLLRFAARLYLSNVRSTELAFSITSNSTCYAIETTPGYAEVDSICGLSFRLIESTLTKYVAPVAYPNPASDRMQFEFGLGLEGRAVLEVFDMQGRRVGLLVDSELASGQYSVEWDVRGMKSGIYWYRLRSGDWVQSGQIRIQK